MAKVSRGEGKEECCEEEQHVGPALGHQSPCSSCLAPVWTCRSPVSAGNPGMAEPSLGLLFGEGESFFFPRPILHFEIEQAQWLALILVENFASVSAF